MIRLGRRLRQFKTGEGNHIGGGFGQEEEGPGHAEKLGEAVQNEPASVVPQVTGQSPVGFMRSIVRAVAVKGAASEGSYLLSPPLATSRLFPTRSPAACRSSSFRTRRTLSSQAGDVGLYRLARSISPSGRFSNSRQRFDGINIEHPFI